MTDFGKRLDGPGGRRAAPREPVLLTAALLTVGCSRPVIILDLSETGAQMQVHQPLRDGQQVWIKAAPIEVFGTVVWIDGEQCGIAFDESLAEDELALLQANGRIVIDRRLSPDQQLAVEDWKTGLAR